MTDLPLPILDKLRYVARYVGEESDWIRVKKELLSVLAPKNRSLFSRRHKTSKKHFLNDFEKELIKTWKDMTGVELKIEESRLHKPSDERPPRYWALMQLNKHRQQEAAK
jgi:hypothetical protein